MTDDVEATVAAARRELVEPWATLFAAQRFYGEKVRKQTLQAYGRLCDAHLLITSVLAAALLRINGKIVPIDWAHEERKALVALFVIGLEVCENAIVQGRYLQSLVTKVAGCGMQPTKGGGGHGSSAVRSRCREAAAEPSELVELPGVALLQC